MWQMPDLSKTLSELPDLTTCKDMWMITNPNTLTGAAFLTQRKALALTDAGHLTVPGSHAATPAPAPRPVPANPTPSVVPSIVPAPQPQPPSAHPAAPGNQAGSSQSGSGSTPGNPQVQPSTPEVPGAQPNQPGNASPGTPAPNAPDGGPRPDGAAVDISPPRMTDIPALILPDRQTVRAGGLPATVSGHVISLDSQGNAFVVPDPNGHTGASPAIPVSVSREQIAREGGISIEGTKIPAFGTSLREIAAEEEASAGSSSQSGSGVSTGSGAGSGLSGSRIGQTISGIGAWIASGLGTNAGSGPTSGGTNSASNSIAGQNGGRGRNSTVVPFTGSAPRDTPMTGLALLAVIAEVLYLGL
ncbi:Hypothetical protein D9617_5g068630 [Elsinoe fawcettii]|nr:Hypothetical protein D9617_5g068630 [Elsinoe fawcettii]